MDSALSIIGFYFTLIGFISGLFFTRLDNWYGQVREFSGEYSGELPEKKNTTDNCRKNRVTLMGLMESAPQGSFITVGCLTTTLMFLSWGVPVNNAEINPFIYLWGPLLLTVLIYWSGGIFLLNKGYKKLNGIGKEIDKVLGPINAG